MTGQVAEIIRFRELALNLVLRDLNVRYKGTTLGFFWSLAGPLVQCGVFYFLFTRVIPARVPDYPLFLLCGVFPWSFLSIALADATLSVTANAGLVRRAYFPRGILPLSPVLAGLAHLTATLVLVLAVTGLKGAWSWALLALPAVMLLNAALVYGLGLVTSCAHAFFRDVHWIVGTLLGLWFYASPVFYSRESIPAGLQAWYALNPVVGLLESYRAVLIAGRLPDPAQLVVPGAAAVLSLAAGFWAYRRWSPLFAEEV